MGHEALQLALINDNGTNKGIDPDYQFYLLKKKDNFKDGGVVANKKCRENEDDNDSYDDEENDPQFEHFLEKMKESDKSYIVEAVENGSPLFITYEGESSSDRELDVIDSGRKLRSMTNQRIEASNRILGVENRQKSEKVKNVKLSTEKRKWDGDYLSWKQNVEVVGSGHYVYKFGGCTVVYRVDGEYDDVKSEYNDVEISGSTFESGCSSDVEILESGFEKMNEALDTKDDAKFRETVIAALREPYNEQEYEWLLQEVEFRRPEERHLDLRHGRERSYAIMKQGKSYLDHYPVLRRKLKQVQNDKASCLNLLRGFFVWLKQPGPLYPWNDEECLAIKPGSQA